MKKKTQNIIQDTRRTAVVLLLLAAILVTALVPAQAASFTDVSSSAWYADAVSYVTSKGLFQGTTTTTFSPNTYMPRGMFLTVLGRYAGVDASAWCAGTITGSGVNLRSGPGTNYAVLTTMAKGTSVTILGTSGSWYKIQYGSYTGYVSGDYLSPTYHQFTDVDYSDYYAGYAIWAYEKGIVDGDGSSAIFAPNAYITREQICKILDAYVSYASITFSSTSAAVTFTDQGDISSWALTGVTAMQKAGIVLGEASGSGYAFRPKSYATRAEAAVMFQRLGQNATSSSSTTAPPAPTATAAPSATSSPTVTATPAPTATPSASETADTPANFLSSTISVKSKTIRVGLYMSTAAVSTSVQTVTLYNSGGSGFEYGSFGSDRSFTAAGTIADNSLTITTDGSTFTVKGSSGTVVYTGSGNLGLHPLSSGKALTTVNGNYRFYGDFELRQAYNRSGYISVINYVDVEDYIKGVIPYEFSPSWPSETLKAAAIVCRNYVMSYDWSTYSSFGCDVLMTTQTYYGRGSSYSDSYFSTTDAAVDATKNVYLTYYTGSSYALCTTYYFSSDGGATEDAGHIWGTSYSYLTGKLDPYEAAASSLASYYSGSITLSRTSSTLNALAQSAGLGSTTIAADGIQIETYPATGNVKSITITGENGKSVTITQSTSYTRWNFLASFGFSAYSYNFSVTYDAATDSFTCTRRGWGHNVGMSQWGAYAMAKTYGKNYQQILGFYYTGTYLQYGA